MEFSEKTVQPILIIHLQKELSHNRRQYVTIVSVYFHVHKQTGFGVLKYLMRLINKVMEFLDQYETPNANHASYFNTWLNMVPKTFNITWCFVENLS